MNTDLDLHAGHGPWGGNDGSLRDTLKANCLDPERFIESLDSWGYRIVTQDQIVIPARSLYLAWHDPDPGYTATLTLGIFTTREAAEQRCARASAYDTGIVELELDKAVCRRLSDYDEDGLPIASSGPSGAPAES